MSYNNRSKLDRNSLTAKRGVIVFFLISGLLMFICLFKLFFLTSTSYGDTWRGLAEDILTKDQTLTAQRGTIYDCNMEVLAQSADTKEVSIDPSLVTEDSVDSAGKKKEGNINVLVNGLSKILGLDSDELRETILSYKNAGKRYYKIASQVENDKIEEIKAYITAKKNEKDSEGNNIGIDISNVVIYTSDSKRYYPKNELASTLLGFTNGDGEGVYGIEAYYNDILKGVDGRKISKTTSRWVDLPDSEVQEYQVNDGQNLVLTLDSEIQTILQDALKSSLEETNAKGVYGIVMNTKTGAILAAANLPDYDPNSPSNILYPSLVEYFKENGKESEKANPETTAQQDQWNNKSFSEFYYPGSVYKVFLVAGALEEGVITENTTYNCTGTITYKDETKKDAYTTGHGLETPETLLVNSCNCFSVEVGLKMGIDLFFKYFEAFGFTEQTGIDVAGEGSPSNYTYVDPDVSFTYADLMSASFGQANTVTPLQVITAVSAIGNGGKLMTPYVVAKTTDSNGNTVSETTPTVKRQVISESTAATVASYMRSVVKSGTGKNANVPGYKVAGKTGTSEKVDSKKEDGTYEHIASFAGFAPYDDPEISVIIVIDAPQSEQYYGSEIATPVAYEVFEKTLEYLGVEPEYDDDEIASMTVETPDCVGQSVEDIEEKLESEGFTVKVIGSGETVLTQTPEAGKSIYSNGYIALYTDTDTASQKVKVPDFTGLSVKETMNVAEMYGLNVKISGASTDTSGVAAYKQDKDAETEVDIGTVITVSFRTTGGTAD